MLPIGIISNNNKTYFLLVNELKKRKIPFLIVNDVYNGNKIKFGSIIIVKSKKGDSLKQRYHDRVIVIPKNANDKEIKLAITLATYFSRAATIIKSKFTKVVGIDPGKKRIGLALLINGIFVYKTIHCSIDSLVDDLRWIIDGMGWEDFNIFLGNGCKECANEIEKAIQKISSEIQIIQIDETSSNITNSDADAATEIAMRGYQKLIYRSKGVRNDG